MLSYCPICESSHHLSEPRLLEQREDGGHLMHIQCRKCASSLLVLVTSDVHGVSSLSILTDLAPDEVEHFWSRERVTADDVLSMHAVVSEAPAGWMTAATT